MSETLHIPPGEAVEDDFHEALSLARGLEIKLDSEMLWRLARAIHDLRARGPAAIQDPEAPIFFHSPEHPHWDESGQRIVHQGRRFMNGLFAVCGVSAPDEMETFQGAIATTCLSCVRMIATGAK